MSTTFECDMCEVHVTEEPREVRVRNGMDMACVMWACSSCAPDEKTAEEWDIWMEEHGLHEGVAFLT